ncbi:DUF3592 domain-containing protein [Kosakonia sp. BYX6]|uniref:DUF3592 domain-containing protein n=1 Tax=Kosakonia calanthes TaxID=3139408 RepID=A0ABZ3B9H2_9ENTR
MATIGLWIAIIFGVVAVIILFIGIRNSVNDGRENEEIKSSGKETTALITHAEQDKNQNVEGLLHLKLSLEFVASDKKIDTQREIFVRIFHADEFKPGKTVSIRYMENNPTKLIVMGNAHN